MPTKPSTIEAYLAGLSNEQRSTIEQMRAAILSVAPGAEAVFSYSMPGFKLDGQPLAWVAAWKHHYGMYPLTGAMVDANRAALSDYELEKGTVRFPASEGVPLPLIKKLVRARVAELRGRKAVAKKRR